jgi:hypothetical protein
MTDYARETDRDEDRLPWLEPAGADEPEERASGGRIAALVIAALLALGIVIGGIWLLRGTGSDARPGDPTLIAAPKGEYKVRPTEAGGMKVEGRGDSAFAASDGAEANGRVDLNAVPEAPAQGEARAGPAQATAKASANPTVAIPKTGGALVASRPTAAGQAGTRSATPGGKIVQLGSFASEAKANEGWSMLSRRFAYLGSLQKTVVTANVGGTTVYRLRADAGADASTICGKLRVAGENCLIVG